MNPAVQRSFLSKHHRLLFYLFLLVLGLVQSRFTELQDDEAYYWVYSKFPDFGYFDHPPMTAYLIHFGYAIFPNESGVRLFPLLLSILSLFIIEKLIDKKNPFLFYSIVLSVAFFQLAGFMAVPDTPLIFFTALFFLCYKRFRIKDSFINTLLLAFSMAFLFYTKYHGLLIVFFVLLSDIKILRKWHAWLAAILALLLFSPHLLWEWEHNFISFRYHLFESNVGAYKFSNTLSYLAGLLLLAGPLVGFILIPASFLYKPLTYSERAMKWMLAGFYIFFFVSSFRGEVEPNWTSPALVPIIVLSHNYLINKPSWSKWLMRLFPISLALIVFVRIIMIEDILPLKSVRQKFHAWKDWPMEMKKRTKGLPIVFSNSYQRASKYWFYSGQTTYSLNHVQDHMNNYDFWPIEDQLIGTPVYFLDVYDLARFPDSLKTPIGYIGYKYDSSFNSFAKIRFVTDNKSYSAKSSDTLSISGSIQMTRWYYTYLKTAKTPPIRIRIYIFKQRNVVKQLSVPINLISDVQQFNISIKPGLGTGNYKLIFSIQVEGYNPTHNSDPIKLIIN